jgi:hypothetical protein
MGEWRYAAPSFTSTLVGDEWSVSRPCRFTLRERSPVTYSIGGWVGPRDGLDAVEWRKMSLRSRESNPSRPARGPLLFRLSSWFNPQHEPYSSWRVICRVNCETLHGVELFMRNRQSISWSHYDPEFYGNRSLITITACHGTLPQPL